MTNEAPDDYSKGTCGACAERPYGHDNFECNGLGHGQAATNHELPTRPGSVIQSDSLLMRTRWNNWVTDAGFIVTDAELAGQDFRLLFDAAADD